MNTAENLQFFYSSNTTELWRIYSAAIFDINNDKILYDDLVMWLGCEDKECIRNFDEETFC